MSDRVAELVREIPLERDSERQFELAQSLYTMLAGEEERGIGGYEPCAPSIRAELNVET